MDYLRGAAIAALSISLSVPLPALGAEAVGQAVQIRTDVTGQSGPIAVSDPIHRDERIRTSSSGLGQFVFRDGTKLAVGLGSSVVVDKFVYDDSNTVKKLTIKAAQGTFRWISGNSDHNAYQILTPAGTIGVRGTAFDFYVGRNGTTAMVLLNGAATFCGAGGCKQLKQQCDCVVANRNGVSDPRRVTRDIFKTLGNSQALPFLSGAQSLTGQLGWVGAGKCGLSTAQKGVTPGVRSTPQGADPSTPSSPSAPQAPSTPQAPSPSAPAPQSTPNTPSTPGTPDTPDPPDNPGKPDHHHHHDWHGHWGHGWDHHGWGDHDGDHDGGFGGFGGGGRR